MRKFFLSRIPTKEEGSKVLWLLLVYSNTFGFIAFSKQIDILTNNFSIWDILGILSYVLMVAAMEAVFVFIILILWSNLLPKFLFRNHYVQWAFIWFVGITAFLSPFILPLSSAGLDEFKTPIIDSPDFGKFLPAWIITIIAIMSTFKWLFTKKWFSDFFDNLLERISVLAKFYLVLDLIGLLLVLLRNIFSFI